MASVAQAFESSRRRDDLTWSHHAAVAGLPLKAQEHWLEQAAAKRLSVADLRIEIRSIHKKERLEVAQIDEQSSHHVVVCPRCGHELSGAQLGLKEAGAGRRSPLAGSGSRHVQP
jgi:hypothetical protein